MNQKHYNKSFIRNCDKCNLSAMTQKSMHKTDKVKYKFNNYIQSRQQMHKCTNEQNTKLKLHDFLLPQVPLLETQTPWKMNGGYHTFFCKKKVLGCGSDCCILKLNHPSLLTTQAWQPGWSKSLYIMVTQETTRPLFWPTATTALIPQHWHKDIPCKAVTHAKFGNNWGPIFKRS